ncbi:hypothetical protein DTO013E5_1192 [Penicillium roqueforti]|nr:hypothetical protein DTO012A1_346 [Penicillium roqueforti]KAI2748492.1 hypothetical protein DTO013F2_6463 [Penicillium roqueforti]KAI2775175.1 hypothetical protein DTO012A8_660 [Penicillium roqueforti]KAI3083807.1 hypothetical protein CBS147339_2183 [Penicillium roqueforti]KAI3092631.1 hypothetical protein CBS147338_7685 [Penicillium roqueforti]
MGRCCTGPLQMAPGIAPSTPRGLVPLTISKPSTMSLQAGSQPWHQTTAIRLLADSLYESTRVSMALTNQAQNELGLLLTVLSATEAYTSSLGAECVHLAVLKKRLYSCHVVLLELQKLLLHPDALGAQSLVSDIRARLSSVIFGLTEVNLNMMISSQKIIERALRCFIDDIRAGTREALAISDILKDSSKLEEDRIWPQLQEELVATGIASDLLTLNRDFVISTFQKTAETYGLLPVHRENTAPVEEVLESTALSKTLELERQRSLDDKDWLADEPTGLPFLPLPPKGFSFSDKRSSYSIQEQPYPEKETIREENFPIPVTLDMQDCTDTQKEALPVEDFPIPVLTENNQDNDMNPPIPVTEPTQPKPSLDLHAFRVSTHSKKPRRMSRILWEMTSSREPFIVAIKANQHQTVQTLLSKGADANAQNTDGTTALMAAVSFGHEATTRLLLEYGADMNVRALKGETALGVAAARGFDRILRMLIASGANINAGKGTGETALSQAAAYGQDRIVEMLLDCGADINAVNSTGDTALALAALNGNMRVARLLLDRGAAVDLMRYPWQTPLYKAVQSNVLEMVRLLMERGADPYVKGGIRRTETVVAYAGIMQRNPQTLQQCQDTQNTPSRRLHQPPYIAKIQKSFSQTIKTEALYAPTTINGPSEQHYPYRPDSTSQSPAYDASPSTTAPLDKAYAGQPLPQYPHIQAQLQQGPGYPQQFYMPSSHPSGYATAIPLHCVQSAPCPVDCPVCGEREMTSVESVSGGTTQ